MARVSARSPQTDDQINGFAAGLPRWLDGLHGDEREQSMPLMLTAMGLALIGGVLVVDTPTNIGHAIYEARTELENSGTLGHITVIVLLTVGLANRYRSGGTDASPVFSSCGATLCTAAESYARDEAQRATDVGVAIHTMGPTGNAVETLLQEIADIGANSGAGGQLFDVDKPADLNDTFNQIADPLNRALIEWTRAGSACGPRWPRAAGHARLNRKQREDADSPIRANPPKGGDAKVRAYPRIAGMAAGLPKGRRLCLSVSRS